MYFKSYQQASTNTSGKPNYSDVAFCQKPGEESCSSSNLYWVGLRQSPHSAVLCPHSWNGAGNTPVLQPLLGSACTSSRHFFQHSLLTTRPGMGKILGENSQTLDILAPDYAFWHNCSRLRQLTGESEWGKNDEG